MPKLVLVNTAEKTHSAYDGEKHIASATFDRTMYADELEDFRKRPMEFLKELGLDEESANVSHG